MPGEAHETRPSSVQTLLGWAISATILASIWGCAAPQETGPAPNLASLHIAVQGEIVTLDGGHEQHDLNALLHSTRNAAAFRDLAEQLAEDKPPARILYLASGAHVAPLAICEALPPETPCFLMLTEIDPTIQHGIASFIDEAERRGYLGSPKDSGELLGVSGERSWRFRVGTRRVTLALRVSDPSAEGTDNGLIGPTDLGNVDLVVSHDWSGDPFGNLDVIRQYLEASRKAELGTPPALMIEDIQNHPYPVDLEFFTVAARTTEAYGHRGSEAGIGRHGTVELGPPIFGGGVVLEFGGPWLRWTTDETMRSFLDFLLLNQFDADRRNALETQPTPLLAPALLDWWSGFGARSLTGGDFALNPELRRQAIEAAVAVADKLDDAEKDRLACRLELYRSLLGLRSASGDLRSVLGPAPEWRTLEAEQFPSDDMRRMYREALRHTGEFRAEREQESTLALQLLGLFARDDAQAVISMCSCTAPAGEESSWTDRYQAALECLPSVP